MNGFTLIELLIYLAIFSIVVGIFVAIPPTAFRVQLRESAVNEVSSQLNFVLQTIQRLIRESSAVIVNNDGNFNDDTLPIGQAYDYLVLRMPDSGSNPSTDRDPIVIWKETGGTIKMKQGTSQSESALTTDKVARPNNVLEFTKFTNYPGHDVVEIELTLNFVSDNPEAQISRTLKTAVSRTSTAIFDYHLERPGLAIPIPDLGSPSTPWRNLYLAGNFKIEDGEVYQPSNYSNETLKTRGMMVINSGPNQSCNEVCVPHTGKCIYALGLFTFAETGAVVGQGKDCSAILGPPDYPEGNFCFCGSPF